MPCACCLLAARFRRRDGLGRGDRRARSALRGFEVASVEPLGDDDAVIDFEVTANRPDCLSVIGLAREVATRLRPAARAAVAAAGATRRADTGADRRIGSADGRRSRTPSSARATRRRSRTSRRPVAGLDGGAAAGRRRPPDQLDRRHHELRADRARPADARLRSRHARRRARSASGGRAPGETITTLDGVERTLDRDMLVIADRDRAQAVAGVMGGAASEVSATTTDGRVRERVLQAGVGPAHQQAARPQDRGVVAIRTRRRHQRARSWRCSARSR